MAASQSLKIALVGVGKIARDHHLPTIAKEDFVELVAVVDPEADGYRGDAASYPTLSSALECQSEIDAVVLCTPPQCRFGLAVEALRAGKHVFLEKPPATGIAQMNRLMHLAKENNVSLFAAWHSQFAAGVLPAKQWLADKTVSSVKIYWKEDVRRWHPGQDWIFEPGGMGVFDPAVNAFSIATAILPEPCSFDGGKLYFPANRQAPIAASLIYTDSLGASIEVELDFLQQGIEQWTIDIMTSEGPLQLSRGGEILTIGEQAQRLETSSEYSGLYRRFMQVIGSAEQDTDIAPLVHVADAFLLSERHIVDDFCW